MLGVKVKKVEGLRVIKVNSVQAKGGNIRRELCIYTPLIIGDA